MATKTSVPPLSAEGVTVEFGGIKILDSVTFNAGPGCLMGVVGPNGAGKSTLFNVITDLLPATSGKIKIHGKSMSESRGVVAYVPQYERVNSPHPRQRVGRRDAGSGAPCRLVQAPRAGG